MKSIGLYGKKPMILSTRQIELAPPGHNHVIVKVRACGVCGTDLNFLQQWPDREMPLGHEIAAEVITTGTGVTELQAGDRVIVEDVSLCGTCPDCKNGKPELCRKASDLDNQPGMGQYLRVPHNHLVKFSELGFVEACLTEPLAVALNSVLQAEIPFRGSVVIIGCGPLGLMTAQVAKLQGAGFVAITELKTNTPLGRARVELAEKMGFDMVIDSSREDLEAKIRKKFPNGVDRIIVSAPPESIYDGLKIIGYGGIIAFYGLHFGGKSTIKLDVNQLIFNKTTLRPVFAEPALNYNIALELIRKDLIPTGQLVTHRFELPAAKQIFNAIVEGSEPVIKAVMLPHGPESD